MTPPRPVLDTHDQPGGPACSGCPVEGCSVDECRADESAGGGGLSGWRLAIASSMVFLVPVVLAAVGAAWVGGSGIAQLGGAAVGMGIGLAAAMGAARWLRTDRGRETPS